jgi:hypothetical protein
MDFIVNGEAGEDLDLDAQDIDDVINQPPPPPPPGGYNFPFAPFQGGGYYRMSNGCSLYTGGSHVEPVNYSAELKSNSWYPQGYSGGSHVMPVNHSAELSRSFNNY